MCPRGIGNCTPSYRTIGLPLHTHQFVRDLQSADHDTPNETPARTACGTRIEGDRGPLEDRRPLSSVRGAEAALRAEAPCTGRERQGAGPAASRDGGAWLDQSRGLQAGTSASRIYGDRAWPQSRAYHPILV